MNSKRLILFGIILACSLSLGFAWWRISICAAPTKEQMEAGRKYMNSLSEQDVQGWIERSKGYLAKSPQEFDAELVPPDLEKLGIRMMYRGNDVVVYQWLGGFADHTCLRVERLQDGKFRVVAQYDDQNRRVMWPK